jgi:hypothetical protein
LSLDGGGTWVLTEVRALIALYDARTPVIVCFCT